VYFAQRSSNSFRIETVARLTIDGRDFSGNRIQIDSRGVVSIDGQTLEDTLHGRVEIHIVEGVIENLDVAGDVHCGLIKGNLDAGGDVSCGDVGGNVDAGADVTCRDVGGNVDAGSDVACGDVKGSIDAGGSVSIRKPV